MSEKPKNRIVYATANRRFQNFRKVNRRDRKSWMNFFNSFSTNSPEIVELLDDDRQILEMSEFPSASVRYNNGSKANGVSKKKMKISSEDKIQEVPREDSI